MKQALQPLKLAIMLAIGIGIGILLAPSRSSGGNRISQILQLIRSNYVDTINTDALEKTTITNLLHSLDPHSNYFTALEAAHVNEPLEGGFEGIGIEFLLLEDTIYIAQVIDDGPSAKAGLKGGDKIVNVDGQALTGMNLSNEDVFKLLKGKEGSSVALGVCRAMEPKILNFKVNRGHVVIKSIDGYFMADPETGYIKISRFAANTMDEYGIAFTAMREQGMKNLILDLRDNGGGYLNTAQKLADEFLQSEAKILTTKGEHTGIETFSATSKGEFEKGKLIVLVNENSASASEILSGALQDNDRALIVGRRTFGKGLVQNSFSLKDGSAVRLTISRYYTPTGRSIQRPYNHGFDQYEDDYRARFKQGELFVEDSIKNNTNLVYTTVAGRRVYGGGGIVPDVFVALDSTRNSKLMGCLLEKNMLREVAYTYFDTHRSDLTKYSSVKEFQNGFQIPPALITQLKSTAANSGVEWDESDFIKSKAEIEKHLKANIAKQRFKNNGLLYIENFDDNTFLKALNCLKSNLYFEKMKF